MAIKKRIYMDCCCLNRPFDDQTNESVALESQAVQIILKHCQKGKYKQYHGGVLLDEIDGIENNEKRMRVKHSLISSNKIKTTVEKIKRAEYLLEQGFKARDALHLATAEKECDVFLSTDYRLVKKAHSMGSEIKVKVINPIDFLLEVRK